MPTPKQVRFHFKKVMKLAKRLHWAMIEAHNADVIKYDSSEYTGLAPCAAWSELEKRILNTTEKQLAQAMREEILNRP